MTPAPRPSILLLNPPGSRNFGRDYYCSKVNKADYVEHPVDLVYLTGKLENQASFAVLDAVVDRMDPAACRRAVLAMRPEFVLFLSGWVSWCEDFPFLSALKRDLPHSRWIGMGDLFLDPSIFRHHEWIDAVLYDFRNDDILEYLRGNLAAVTNMLFRHGGEIVDRKLGKNAAPKTFRSPVPRHDLFLAHDYSFPFARRLPFVTMLTDFGCPFRCRFCVYSEIGYRAEVLADVFRELEYVHSLGVREIFFKDQTFCIRRQRAEALCRFMIDRSLDLSWTCFLRVTQAKPDFLALLRAAGCHTVIYGVESASQNDLDRFRKQTTIAQIRQAVEATREAAIRSVCTFVLGFPGEDRSGIERTVRFALSLDPDYAAFNTYVPKTASLGFAPRPDRTYDQSGLDGRSHPGNGILTGPEILECRRRAVRRFYLRPRYLLRTLRRIRSGAEFAMHWRSFLSVLKSS